MRSLRDAGVGPIDPGGAVLLACGRGTPGDNGSRRASALSRVPAVALPASPGRAEIDPVLAAHAPRRVVVAGTDADLAAVLLRLLRTDRLDVEVGFVPARRSAAARVWGVPVGAAAAELAVTGTAQPVPLVRDDGGGVLVGRGEVRGVAGALLGEAYCDHVLVLRGSARRLVVAPHPHKGVAVRAGLLGGPPDGVERAVAQRAPAGRGSAAGRAVQVGCREATVVRDGVAHPRPITRWAWYRHTTDWLLVCG